MDILKININNQWVSVPAMKGEQGIQGTQGIQGEEGYSPVVSVTETATGYTVSITDSTHTESFTINGKEFPEQPNNDGSYALFCTVSNGVGTLSWEQISLEADNISYDNTTSELIATNVQNAIDEVVSNKQDALVDGNNFTINNNTLDYDILAKLSSYKNTFDNQFNYGDSYSAYIGVLPYLFGGTRAGMLRAFENCNGELGDVKLDILYRGNQGIPFQSAFKNNHLTTKLPLMNFKELNSYGEIVDNNIDKIIVGSSFEDTFSGCTFLSNKSVQDFLNLVGGINFFCTIDKGGSLSYSGFGISQMFLDCKLITNINFPNTWLNSYSTISSNTTMYASNFCRGCSNLQEITNIPIYTHTFIYGNDMFDGCYKIKKITFNYNDSFLGIQNFLDLSTDTLGVCYNTTLVTGTNYLSGITSLQDAQTAWNNLDKTSDYYVQNSTTATVTTTAGNTYTDTLGQLFSNYDHDSAVETINSLPPCDNTATIRFRASKGAGKDKAIGDLTDSEIAVATSKGWSVAFI